MRPAGHVQVGTCNTGPTCPQTLSLTHFKYLIFIVLNRVAPIVPRSDEAERRHATTTKTPDAV
ncbi:hypothetical protein THIOKS11350013 [Thiocapsa sp. KS1]|nr:hypothetical protein THIOKS11350013 [Thiocapsa sp. KS1]